MDKQGRDTEDLLRQFINPERIEKAPEGFTPKLMSLIEAGKIPVIPPVQHRRRTLVPYVFSGFILVLTIIAFFLPASENQTLIIPVLEFLKGLKFTIPEVSLKNLISLDIPSAMTYGLVGILLLSVLDKALYRVFHKQK